MFRKLSITVLALGLVALSGTVAGAQMACGQRDTVIAKLGNKYGEVRRGGGLTGSAGQAGSTAIYEVWASEAGSWTILKTTPDGKSCVMVVGDAWQDDAGNLAPVGSPA